MAILTNPGFFLISREEGGHELVGLLYFHDIAANLWTESHGMNLKCFQQLCEEDLTKLIFTTTMWDDVDEDEGTKWEEELKTGHLPHPRGRSLCSAVPEQSPVGNRDSFTESE